MSKKLGKLQVTLTGLLDCVRSGALFSICGGGCAVRLASLWVPSKYVVYLVRYVS